MPVPHLASRIARLVRQAADTTFRFRRAQGGATAVVFAVALIPVLATVGIAIEYGQTAMTKTQLDDALDSAALVAVGQSNLTRPAASAQQDAAAVFQALARQAQPVVIATSSVTVKDTGLSRTATLSYTAVKQTSMLGLLGVTSMTLAGTSTSTSSLPAYIDFYLLLDNSPSMGVAATTQDIATMVAKTSDRCAFACHDMSNPNNYYNLAKKLGVTMRIDVLRTATQSLMDTATSTATVPNQFRMAISTFGTSCTAPGFASVAPLTNDLASAKTMAGAIDLMTIPYQGYNNDQCTDFDGIFTAVNNAVPAAGDGSTSAAPQKVLFFVSDGVADAFYPSNCTKVTTGGRCQEPIKVADCQKLKDRGIKVAVLYTTYLPLPTNGWYNSWIAPFQSQIGTNMQACASPGLYFEVSPSQGISDAMTALFKKAVAQTRLTN